MFKIKIKFKLAPVALMVGALFSGYGLPTLAQSIDYSGNVTPTPDTWPQTGINSYDLGTGILNVGTVSFGQLNMSGSILFKSAAITVGSANSQGVMVLSNGVVLDSSSTLRNISVRGASASAVSRVTMTGSQTQVIIPSVKINLENNSYFEILNGAKVTNSFTSYIGNSAGSVASMLISGVGSTLSVSNYMNIGRDGSGSVTVEKGGQLLISKSNGLDSSLATNTGSKGTLIVKDSGSLLTGSKFDVGVKGEGYFELSNRARAELYILNIGASSTSYPLHDTGTGRVWIHDMGTVLTGTSLIVIVGNVYGGVGDLWLTDQAQITGASMKLYSGSAYVSDVNTRLSLTGQLDIGYAPPSSVSILELTNGATLKAANVNVGYLPTGSGGSGTLSINNGASATFQDKSVTSYIGQNRNGYVNVENGSKLIVNNNYIYIGYSLTGVGVLRVDGVGSEASFTLNTAPSLMLGHQGKGQVILSNQGKLSLAANKSLLLANTATAVGVLTIGADSSSPPVAPGVLNASQVVLGAGEARIEFNHTSDNYLFTAAVSGTGNIVSYSGITHLTGNNNFSGSIKIFGGEVVIEDPSVLGPNLGFQVGDGGRLDFNNKTMTIGALINYGTVLINQAEPGVTLTVGRLNAPGGLFVMRANLDTNDNSELDRLVVTQNDTVGTTYIKVENLHGAGAMTTGEGLSLLHVENILMSPTARSMGLFALAEPVEAGAYIYTLHASDDYHDWFLRSTLENPIEIPPDNNKPDPPVEEKPGGDDNDPGVLPEPLPNYRLEVSLYTAIPALLNEVGAQTLVSFTDREHANEDDIWFKTYAMSGQLDRHNLTKSHSLRTAYSNLINFENSGSAYDYSLYGFQLGKHLYHAQMPQDKEVWFGLYSGVTRLDSDVAHLYGGHAGDMTSTVYSLTPYLSYKYSQDIYMDAQIQFNAYRDLALRSSDGHRSRTNAWSMTPSVELGYTMRLNENNSLNWAMNIAYQSTRYQNLYDHYSTVTFSNDAVTTSQLGVKWHHNLEQSTDNSLGFTLGLAAIHRTGTDSKISFYDPDFRDLSKVFYRSFERTSLKVEAGLIGALSKNWDVNAKITYQQSVDHSQDRALGLMLNGVYRF